MDECMDKIDRDRQFSKVCIMLQCNTYGATPANTRFVAVNSSLNLKNQKEISPIYLYYLL
jgi:hypothetical protein